MSAPVHSSSEATAFPPPDAAFFAALEAIVGPDGLSRDSDDLATYGKDWTRVYSPRPCAVVFPRSTHDVSRILALCNARGVAVVPSGGRTGLAAGAVATRNELVLSVSRMRAMHPVDALGATVRVQAGAVTQSVHDHVADAGLTWPIDFAAKGSSVIGGNIATNAGGVRVIRYGLTREWVLGVQVVLASGVVLELNGALEKNNTGIDLRQIFIGSEGTLGVITEATLKLARLPDAVDTMIFGVRDLRAVLALFEHARRGPFEIMAFEFFTDRCLERVRRHRSLRDPVARAENYVLLEVEAAHRERLDAWLEDLLGLGLVLDATMAQTKTQSAEFWSIRESIGESLAATGLPHKNDVAVPIAALGSFCTQLDAVFATNYPGWEVCVFGHIGDGNLHVNVMKPDEMQREDFFARTHDADAALFELVRAHKGSISAEHGIGMLKRDFLPYSRSEDEIAIFRALKSALDPNGILNPGKVF